MRCKAFVLVVLTAGFCFDGVGRRYRWQSYWNEGHSVVYVSAIANKTFPAPKEHPVMIKGADVCAPHHGRTTGRTSGVPE